jgi:proteasome assembly chaperone (PAC2) family protein
MDKPFFREMFKPNLENPVFVQGLPGFGNVGRIAAHLLIKFSEAKPFAELYSPSFPDYVSISTKGIAYVPKYEFYSAPMETNNLIIMTGETQPSFDDVLAHYQVCSEIVDFVEKLGCHFSKGRIVGGTGLTLALAKEHNLEGVCLLGTTTGFKADRGAGFRVFKFLMKALGKEIKEGL